MLCNCSRCLVYTGDLVTTFSVGFLHCLPLPLPLPSFLPLSQLLWTPLSVLPTPYLSRREASGMCFLVSLLYPRNLPSTCSNEFTLRPGIFSHPHLHAKHKSTPTPMPLPPPPSCSRYGWGYNRYGLFRNVIIENATKSSSTECLRG